MYGGFAMENNLTVIILALVGALIQLLFKYFPKLSTWYAGQPQKALIMVAVVAVVSVAYFGLGCISILADKLNIQVAVRLTERLIWVPRSY
jgi:hypothetical protein